MASPQERESVLTRAQRKVLADLEFFQDSDGRARLSVRELADLTGFSRSHVGRAIAQLNDLNLILSAPGTSGKRTAHRILHQVLELSEPDPCQNGGGGNQ